MTEAIKNNLSLYTKRFSRVLDYIEHNLEKTLSVEELAGVAHFSRFHFQRQFSEHVGMTVNRYIQLLRLRRASYQLVFMENRLITDIALDAGFGIIYHDPANTPADEFRFDICGEVDGPIPGNTQGVSSKQLEAGRCAVVRHEGSLARVAESIYPIYREWLPSSGEELRDFPMFFHYLKRVPEVDEHEQITDIYLPLK
jgi:DNA gyrase inhibitor GyrI